MNNDKFIEVAKKKDIINKLQGEVNLLENDLRKTFSSDVKDFFTSKGYEFDNSSTKVRFKFKDLRQLDERSTFKPHREPVYLIAGKNYLIIRFEWWLQKNSNPTTIYWYPEQQTLDDFYNRRLKKTLKLPIKVERKNKLDKIKEGAELI